MKVSYVAINYRTPQHVQGFLQCFRDPLAGTRVWVVDNTEAAHRVPLTVDPHQCEWAACVTSPGNLGYFGGARFGLELAFAGGADPDWVVVSNVDVRLDPSEVARSLHTKEVTKSGVIAPAVTSSATGAALNPFMSVRPSRSRMHLYKNLFRYYWGYAAYSALSGLAHRFRHRPERSPEPGTDRRIYSPHGSIMIFSREFFARGGSLAHPPFLYGEEITVAERARELGLPVEFVPSIRVEHQEHASMSALPGKLQHRFISEAATYAADAYFS